MNKNVSEVFNIVIEKLSNTERVRNGHIVVGSSNARKYRYVRDCLSNFTLLSMKRNFRELTFIDIDENFLRKYVEYLNGHNVEDKLQKLRRVFREANASTAVFDKIKIAQLQSIMEKSVDHSCISKIMSMDRSRLTAKEQLHIDLFLFGYCTGGSTINELAMLKRDNVQKGYFIVSASLLERLLRLHYADRLLILLISIAINATESIYYLYLPVNIQPLSNKQDESSE